MKKIEFIEMLEGTKIHLQGKKEKAGKRLIELGSSLRANSDRCLNYEQE